MSTVSKRPPISSVLPYAWVILAVAYLASVAAPFNQFKVPPIMPLLLTSLNIDLAQAGFLMSSMALVGLLLALPAGVILQRLGLKLTGLIALGCIGLGAAAGANASSFNQLLLSRVIEGIGIGLIGVTAPAAIAMWFPPDRQGAPMGLWATWVPVGTLVMYLFAPALAAANGWQMVWWVGAGYALLAGVIYALFMRQPPALRQPGLADPHDQNILKAISNRNIWLLALTFACFNLIFVGFATYFPTFLHEARGDAALAGCPGFQREQPGDPVFSPGGWLALRPDRVSAAGLFAPLFGGRGVIPFPFSPDRRVDRVLHGDAGVDRRRNPHRGVLGRPGGDAPPAVGRVWAGGDPGGAEPGSVSRPDLVWGIGRAAGLGQRGLSDDPVLPARFCERLDGEGALSRTLRKLDQ